MIKGSSKTETIPIERPNPLARTEEIALKGANLVKIDSLIEQKLKETESTTQLAQNISEMTVALVPGYINSLK